MKIKVSKIEAATRQLDQAIELWFTGGDLIAIHTLASSSHQIVYDIVQSKNGPDLLFDSLIFRDEYRKKVNDLLRHPQNFFKHANSDPNPNAVIEFDDSLPEMFFMMSLKGLEHLKVRLSNFVSAYLAWFALVHPEFLTKKGMNTYSSLLKASQAESLRSSKKEFFRLFILACKTNEKA